MRLPKLRRFVSLDCEISTWANSSKPSHAHRTPSTSGYLHGVNTIWRKDDEEWQRLIPSGFPSEEKLHDLVAEAPSLLPLSGDPTVVMLGREVGLGPGWADLIAVESDGRLVVIEIKLSRNSEAKRKVVAQVLTYAAYLKGIGVSDLDEILDKHLEAIDASSVVDAANAADEYNLQKEYAYDE